MSVGVVGGYDPKLMLPGFKDFMGIAGPVIGHDTSHYIFKHKKEGDLDGWIQSDQMFFHDGAM